MVKAIFKYRGDKGYLQYWDTQLHGREIFCYVFESEEKGVRDKKGAWKADEPKWIVWIEPKHSSVRDLKPQVPSLEEEPDDIKYRYEIEFEPKTDKDGNPSNSFITNADGTDKDTGITVIDKSVKVKDTWNEKQKEQRRQQKITDLKAQIQFYEAMGVNNLPKEDKASLVWMKAELAKLEKQQPNKDDNQEREREREQNWGTTRANCWVGGYN